MERRCLCLFPPGALETFQRFDAVSRVIVHPLEDDKAISWGCDHIAEHFEAVRLTQSAGLQLRFDQQFGRLRQILLHLADTDRAHALAVVARLSQTVFDQQAAEEVTLATTTTAP